MITNITLKTKKQYMTEHNDGENTEEEKSV